MSTRYVWEKNNFTLDTTETSNEGMSVTSLGINGVMGYGFTRLIDNGDGTYSAGGDVIEAKEYTVVESDNSISYRSWVDANLYPFFSGKRTNFTEYLHTTESEEVTWKGLKQPSGTSITVGLYKGSGENASGSHYIYYTAYRTKRVLSKIGDVSSSNKATYPTATDGGLLNGYWYVYKGADRIDPTDISYSTTAYQGEKLYITVTRSSAIKYGGTITYLYEMSKNGGAYNTDWYQSTKEVIYCSISENNTGTLRFRVKAKDDMGFTSTTYVTGPIATIIEKYDVLLAVSPPSGGTVTGAGTYNSGTSVTVKATPANHYIFVGWQENGATVSTSASYTFTISKDRNLTAVFREESQYAITLAASPPGGGTVSGGGSFYDGTSITVRATVNDGYEFIGWKEGSATVSTSLSYAFTVTKSRSLTAVFKQKLALWVGINGKARKGVELYVGVNGKARKVVSAYVGVNGKARRFL